MEALHRCCYRQAIHLVQHWWWKQQKYPMRTRSSAEASRGRCCCQMFSISVSQGARPERAPQRLVCDGNFKSADNHLRREKPQTQKSSFHYFNNFWLKVSFSSVLAKFQLSDCYCSQNYFVLIKLQLRQDLIRCWSGIVPSFAERCGLVKIPLGIYLVHPLGKIKWFRFGNKIFIGRKCWLLKGVRPYCSYSYDKPTLRILSVFYILISLIHFLFWVWVSMWKEISYRWSNIQTEVMDLWEISTDMYREARACFRSIGRMSVEKNERKTRRLLCHGSE